MRSRPNQYGLARGALVATSAIFVGVPMLTQGAAAARLPAGHGSSPGTSQVSNAPALLPTPKCPVPTVSQPWLDAAYGADCQAQYVIDDLHRGDRHPGGPEC